MIIFPAIDMIDGRPVRLTQGDYKLSEQVAEDVLQTACGFEQQGATWIHMVDLDGAKAGYPINMDQVRRVTGGTSLNVQLGGGIRSLKDIELAFAAGVSRVVLGTVAIDEPDIVKAAVDAYEDRIAVGIDAKDGYARVGAWLTGSDVLFTELALAMSDVGVRTIIYTDISHDGTMRGPNLIQLAEIRTAVPDVDVIASGGIRDIPDLQVLSDMGLYGAICGKAIYYGSIDLREALKVLK